MWTDEKQRWEESEKRREEKRREEKRREEEDQKEGRTKNKIKKVREEERSKRESLRRQKIQVRKKVGKSRCTVFFQWFVAPEGRKVGSKAAGAEPAGMRDKKLHAVVARRTFPSQNVQNTPLSDHFWKLRCRKSARRCGAKHISKSKCTKQTRLGPLLEVEMSKKCTPLWREAHFEVKSAKNCGVQSAFGRSDVVLRGRCKGLWTLSKVSKTWGFSSISKSDGTRGTFDEDLQTCIFRGRQSTRDMFNRDVRKSGRWFPERGCILEHQIFRFAELILRDRCSTSYDLASLFRGKRSTLDRWSGKIAKRIVKRLSALHIFEGCLAELFRFWCCQLRKLRSRRIVSFLTLSSSKIEEVSQNCFVFDVVKFKNWDRLAELLRFWRCQVLKLRTSRRICCVFKLADRQTDRQTNR